MSSIYDQCFTRKIKRLDSIQNPTSTLPQINKSMQMRPMSPKRENSFCTIKEECKKNGIDSSDYYITPFSPKLKPRNIRIELGEKIMRRATEDKENTKEDLNAPIRRTIRIRSIKESQGRKRLFSQEASRGSGLNTEDDAPPNTCDKKLYDQVKTKGSHDKVFSWNLTDYQPKSPTVESKKVDMKKVSKLAQLLKIQS